MKMTRLGWRKDSMLNNNQSADVIHCFSSDGRDITDKNEIVERFNEYFVNLG